MWTNFTENIKDLLKSQRGTEGYEDAINEYRTIINKDVPNLRNNLEKTQEMTLKQREESMKRLWTSKNSILAQATHNTLEKIDEIEVVEASTRTDEFTLSDEQYNAISKITSIAREELAHLESNTMEIDEIEVVEASTQTDEFTPTNEHNLTIQAFTAPTHSELVPSESHNAEIYNMEIGYPESSSPLEEQKNQDQDSEKAAQIRKRTKDAIIKRRSRLNETIAKYGNAEIGSEEREAADNARAKLAKLNDAKGTDDEAEAVNYKLQTTKKG